MTAVAITRSIATGLTHPFGKPFKVTAKGVDRSKVRVHWPLVRLLVAIIAVTLAGIAYTVLSPDAPTSLDALSRVNFVWAGFAMLVCVLCIVACVDRPRPAEELFDPVETVTVERTSGLIETTRLVRASTTLAEFEGSNDICAFHLPSVGRIATPPDTDPHRVRLEADTATVRRLTVRLYAGYRSGVADTGHLIGTLRSAFRSARSAPQTH